MQLAKFYYSVKYTSVDQLFARLRLTIKRKYASIFSEYLNRKFKKNSSLFKSKSIKPKQIFPNRTGRFQQVSSSSKTFKLEFLNQSYNFSIPLKWHPDFLEYGTRLWKLNLHYHEFLEEVDDIWFEEFITDWINQNPPYKKGYWLDSWNSFSLSIRVVVWMQQIERRENSLGDEFIRFAEESLYKQICFLLENIEEDIRGNHIVKNIKALLWGCSYFVEDQNVKKWENKAQFLLKRELGTQILDDGFHFELSPSYHGQVFADLLECYSIIDDVQVKDDLSFVLQKMASVLHNTTHPDGFYSLFNDGGLNMTYSPELLLQSYQRLCENVTEDLFFIDYLDAGYFGIRNTNHFLLIDAGKVAPDTLPAHGHGDIFSFEWSINGHRLFIDKGVFEYNEGTLRNESRSTLSHNTVSLGNNDQCEFWGSFRLARRASVKIIEKEFDLDNKKLKLIAEHDGYKRLKGKPVHRRKFEFLESSLFIEDEIINGSGQKAVAHFLLHPNVTVSERDSIFELSLNDTLIRVISPFEIKIEDTRWFPDFGVSENCQKLSIVYGNIPVRGYVKFEVISNSK